MKIGAKCGFGGLAPAPAACYAGCMRAICILVIMFISLRVAHAQPVQCVSNIQGQGTPNAITSANLPCALTTNILVMTNGVGPNTISAPTYQPLGLPAQVIVRADGTALQVGDTGGIGTILLFSPTGAKWVLLNPQVAFSGAIVPGTTGQIPYYTGSGPVLGPEGPFGAGLPIFGNGSGGLTTGTVSGTGTEVGTVTGSPVNGHCVQWNAGNLIDAGAACGSGGGGSGTVSAGTAGQFAYYAVNGTTVSGTALPPQGYVDAVTVCGVDNTGTLTTSSTPTIAQNTTALQNCINQYGSVILRPQNNGGGFTQGVVQISSHITMPSNAVLECAGGWVYVGSSVIITTTATNDDIITFPSGMASAGQRVRGCGLTHAAGVTPTFGCGVDAPATSGSSNGASLIENVNSFGNFTGFCFGPSTGSFCEHCTAASNVSNGFQLAGGPAITGIAWGLNHTYSLFNGGVGYGVSCATGTGNNALGVPWVDAYSFANTGGGFTYSAATGCTLSDIELISATGSSDNGDEVFLNTGLGINNKIIGGLFEEAGQLATGPGSSTPAGHVGNGINVISIADLTVSGASATNNSNVGIVLQTVTNNGENGIILTGNNVQDNSLASPNTQPGILNEATTGFVNVTGNISRVGNSYALQTISGDHTVISGNIFSAAVNGCSGGGATTPSGSGQLYNIGGGCP